MDVLNGGLEINGQFIAAGANGPASIEGVRMELIVRASDLRVVKLDGRDGVQPVKDQIDALMIKHAGLDVEFAPILPVTSADPLRAQFVVGNVRMADDARPNEVGVNATGNAGTQ